VAFSRWDPLLDMLAQHERLHKSPGGPASLWTPPVDLYETDDHYVVAAELPGIPREGIQISVQDGKLTLHGERPEPAGDYRQIHRLERGRGAFGRTLDLPQPIDEDRITAEFSAGVITVTIPKAAVRQPRRIEVR
jgi:HSP20 family protein